MVEKTFQVHLHLLTESHGMRAEVVGWGGEDPRLLVMGRPIGMTPTMRVTAYPTVLHALADGWRLLAPPSPDPEGWDWWLVKEVTRGR